MAKCIKCKTEVRDYGAEYCCGGQECGCYGLPLEPCICDDCWKRYMING